ncbi:cellulose-binding domain-containing protein [Streptomyces blattellae]|uniref:cellulose-binding domain-containing protein n=1 Tax=Streptomyces blattellae TaxID=2569855 RepID=UPI001E37B34D|nr:cellulose-binding domain-containing protein [Streptomyces blattellae]
MRTASAASAASAISTASTHGSISRRAALSVLAAAAVGVPAAAMGRSNAAASSAPWSAAADPVACAGLPTTLPAPGSLPVISELPDPFTNWDGTRLAGSAEWSCRRAQISELAQYYEYGHLPPAPTSVTGTRSGTSLTVSVQANGRSASFTATVRLPSGSGPFPALILLNGLAASPTSRGYAEVSINPNSIAADSTSKTGAFWTLYNGADVDTGVLMAWAWGVHRTLDAIEAAVPEIDSTKVGVSGYSRYGKAALVAGAFDERIALTVPGSGGTAGMGNYRFFFTNGSNDETLNDILGAAYWFTPRFSQFRNQANRLPFDQHEVAALVAPRLLLTTNGTEGSDIRTNPQGTGLSHRGAKMVYQYLGVADHIGISYRPGGHQIDIADYNAIMDFADKYLMGKAVSRTFDNVPYPAPTPAQIPWTVPGDNSTPPPTTDPPAGPCSGTYRVVNQWSGGFQGEVTVRAGDSALNGWTVRWELAGGQTLTQIWGGVSTVSGSTVTVRNASYNGAIPAGGTTTFGFLATSTGTITVPDLACASS